MKQIMLVLSVLFIALTFVGAGYILYNAGNANAGYAVIPMVFALACTALYHKKSKETMQGSKKVMEHSAIKSDVFAIQEKHTPWHFLNATTIKFLAAALMFVDHIHQMFSSMGVPQWLDLFGRPVFPLFLFLAADSFHYTRSKKGYIKRLLLASWCMTLLTYITAKLVPNETVSLMNNAFSTFFVAALYMLGWDFLREGLRGKEWKKIREAVLIMLIPIIFILPTALMLFFAMNGMASAGMIQALAFVSLLLPNLIAVEGGPLYVLLGLLFYMFRKNRRMQITIVVIFGVMAYLISGGVQWAVALAAIPMALYNGQKGKGAKNFFYIFYPAHIIALYLLATCFMNL